MWLPNILQDDCSSVNVNVQNQLLMNKHQHFFSSFQKMESAYSESSWNSNFISSFLSCCKLGEVVFNFKSAVPTFILS